MVSLAPSTPLPTTADQDETFSALNHDILQTHILTRLDGPTLASVSCASSDLHSLSSEDKLWQNICTSTWPSVNDPLISTLISTFPSGHRSFFSDSYPLLHHQRPSCTNLEALFPTVTTTELVSAVDIYYQNVPIFSKVEKTEAVTGWFLNSPFRVDLLEPKEFVPTRIQQVGGEDSWLKQLEENLTLSWILIDPKDKRAVNMSSNRAVSVQRHWLTGEVQVKFATILGGERGGGGEKAEVGCEVVVTCGGKEGGEVQVRDVSMGMEDMEGKALMGKESLVILKEAMEKGERKKLVAGKGMKEKYGEFVERRRERKETKERRENVLDWICIGAGVTCFVAFWSFVLFR
ncbi:F-box protein At2g27310-like [Mercurialis annua]|uniref:F-box protein At2g27310-like n=1 Tax=Mercurialis annua TaxID=3986 RepID=UPI00215EB61D|nr:F-box protein At2g27310-like [Mercurialis annua]